VTTGPAPLLWQVLLQVSGLLQEVQRGRSLSGLIEQVPAPLRGATLALVHEALRHWGTARQLQALLTPRAPAPPARALLQTALALACAQRPGALEQPLYPPHTLVSQAVEAARRSPRTAALAGLINACLRRFEREREALLAQALAHPEGRWNHPDWWVERLRRDHPEHWERVLQSAQQRAPLTLRAHRPRMTREALQAQLQAAGHASTPVGQDGLVLAAPTPVTQLPGYAEGWFAVQDAGAQLAAPLLLQGLTERPGLRVLDACAAPGGKTTHLLALAPKADVTALEVDAARTERIHQNLARLGLQARVRCADAAEPEAWWDGKLFDAILLDAPCTASGIVRRHPDVRWLRRPGDSAQLAHTQLRLLQALWPLLKPGGRLLYCTCSVFQAEGPAVVQAFLAHNTDAAIAGPSGHLIPGIAPDPAWVGDNWTGEHDGFYYARLDKRAL